MLRYKQPLLLLVITVVGGLSLGACQAASVSGLQSVAQSYGAAAPLADGLIVRLDQHNGSQVVTDSYSTDSQMLGVVVAASAPPVTLSPGGGGHRVFVAAGGRYPVQVSDQNGAIRAGDYIGISALSGVGMKADGQEPTVLGQAVSGFDGRHNVVGTASLPGGKGAKVALGRVTVALAVAPNPATEIDNGLPSILRRAVKAITPKPVAPWRGYLALAVVVAAVLLAGALLYSAVRGGIMAVGRNPLARGSIMGSVLQVTITSLIVFIIGVLGAYLIIKL